MRQTLRHIATLFIFLAFAAANAKAQKIVFAVDSEVTIDVINAMSSVTEVKYSFTDADFVKYTGPLKLRVGSELKLRITRNGSIDDKTFAGWYIGEQLLSTETQYTHKAANNATIEARFKDIEYVDLGLPSGTLWAATNYGALDGNDVGESFSWSGKPDNMPTVEQWQELIGNCSWSDYNSYYYIVSMGGTNGNHIGLPKTDGTVAHYWTSDEDYSSGDEKAFYFSKDDDDATLENSDDITNRMLVRTVKRTKPVVNITSDELVYQENKCDIQCSITDIGDGENIVEWGVLYIYDTGEIDKLELNESGVYAVTYKPSDPSILGQQHDPAAYVFTAAINASLGNGRYAVVAYAKNDKGYIGYSELRWFSIGIA